uniref:Uncharacterized protein n=1 Tax=Brassica oleracea TaxID=3712 RepID=A0A3P6FER5_BRAOL|nr:unnamed protein product [Brassica oleracea]
MKIRREEGLKRKQRSIERRMKLRQEEEETRLDYHRLTVEKIDLIWVGVVRLSLPQKRIHHHESIRISFQKPRGGAKTKRRRGQSM